MKKKTKRLIASWLVCLICVSMNANPLAVIAGAIVETGIVDRFTVLKNNLIWVSETGGVLLEVRAETSTSTTTCDCDYDYTAMLDRLMEKTNDGGSTTNGVSLRDIQSTITSESGLMRDNASACATTITGAMTDALGYTGGEGNNLKYDMGIVKTKLQGIIDELQSVTGTIGAMQHRYYVAHLLSLNNAFPNALWRPYSEEVPYVKDFAIVTGKFANVYTGYWDSYVSTIDNPGNMRTSRMLEVLGYDAICRAQGVIMQKTVLANFSSSAVDTPTGLSGESVTYTMPRADVDSLRVEDDAGNPVNAMDVRPVTVSVLQQEFIPEDAVCWIDAVTLLYKALGQEQYTYQSFMAHNNAIIPERSPAFQNLANPIPNGKETSEAKLYGTDSYNGFDFYMFLCRDNLIEGTAEENKVHYLYWEKALNGGFVSRTQNLLDPITFADFFKLASRMMQAYGEPVMNDDELRALLQVYGTHYPIQLGTDTADAWAYLAARGILDFSEFTEGNKSLLYDIVNTGTITRDQLLTMAMRIKDKDSRTNFKDIQIVLDLADVMKEDYYYPVYDMSIANGQMSITTSYDHRNSTTFEYLVQRTNDNSLGESGTPMVYSKAEKDDKNLIEGAEVSQSLVEIDGNFWYQISVPKTYDGNIYVGMKAEGDAEIINPKVDWIEIPATALGGGYYAQCTIAGGIATVSYVEGAFLLFDERSVNQTMFCTDWKRAGLQKQPVGKGVASNATVLERVMCLIDMWTTPMYVEAAQVAADPLDGGGTVSTDLRWAETGIMGSDDVRAITNLSTFKLYTWGDVNDLYKTLPNFDGEGKDRNILEFTGGENNYHAFQFRMASGSSQNIVLNRLSLLSEMSYLQSNSSKTDLNAIVSSNGTLGTGVKNVIKGNVVTGSNMNLSSSFDVQEHNGSYWTIVLDGVEPVEMSIVSKLTDRFLADKFILGLKSGRYYINEAYGAHPMHEEDITLSADLNCEDELLEYKKNAVDIVWNSSTDKMATNWVKNGLQAVLPNELAAGRNLGGLYSDLSKVDSNIVDGSKSGGYTLYGTEKGVKAVLDQLGADNFDTYVSASGITGEMLETSLYTTTVMDRNQHIMVSWTDLKKSGFISTTETSSQPKPRDDGGYYFMCDDGQVIVNNVQHTIQVGTTIYDLSYDNGKSPTLVYYDADQGETYFDIRCVMGIITEDFSVEGCVTFTDTKALGSGSYVKYDLGPSGAKSDLFAKYKIMTYNFPETSEYNPCTATRGYTTILLDSTKYDGFEVNCKACHTDPGETHKYWPADNSVTRLSLTSFVPTANWVVVIDDDGTELSGSLFVWYMRTAFEDGYVDTDDTEYKTDWTDKNNVKYAVPEPEGFNEVHKNIKEKVQKASNIITTKVRLEDQLKSCYGFTWDDFDAQPWYIKMTCEAAADLYTMTDGKFYLSEDYVIREFDLTSNYISDCKSWALKKDRDQYVNERVCTNNPGVIYWVDKIGYVYNLPKKGEFSMQGYLEGKYPLPLMIEDEDESASDPRIINYNVNYYGCYNKPDGSSDGTCSLPYGVVLNPGKDGLECKDSPYITLGGSTWSAVSGTGTVAMSSDKDSAGAGISPFVTTASEGMYNESGGPAYFINAPVAIYNWFSGNSKEMMTVGDLTRYITDATKVYYGSAQVKFTGSEAKANMRNFAYVSKEYSELSIPTEVQVFRVYRARGGQDVLIIDPYAKSSAQGGAGTQKINLDDYYTNPLEDWLKGLGTNDLITAIDSGASLLIVIAFNVMPWIGIILMTILIGLAFIGDNKFVQTLADKTIDPVRILTFGGRDIHSWHWRKVLVPCILLYVAFALFLNGNIIRLVMWGAKWYGIISKWARSM